MKKEKLKHNSSIRKNGNIIENKKKNNDSR